MSTEGKDPERPEPERPEPDRPDPDRPEPDRPEPEPSGYEGLERKVAAQVDLVLREFKRAGIDVDYQGAAGGGLDFVFQQHVILVRDEYLDQVARIVGGEPLDGLIDGVTLYSLDRNHSDFPTVLRALAAIDEQLGVGVATPNHVLSTTPVGLCAATEPQEVPRDARPDPGICLDNSGAGALISVVDTGLLAGAAAHHRWLTGATGPVDPVSAVSGEEPHIGPFTGHGTFVAGVARCMAPACEIRVGRIFAVAGAALETEIVKALDQVLGQGPDIISLSAGGTSRKDLPLLGFEGFWRRYRHLKGTVLVAAAGNNGDRRPFWPAAFPHVVSVGALAANWRSRADFSDYGSWVDVYAPGEGIVNAFATGVYTCHEPPDVGRHRHFHGMARWSGTSFSTPLVAGLIAARMSRTGESGRRAADALLARAQAQPLDGMGPVLLPCETGDIRHREADCGGCRCRCRCGQC
jgi:subtilisin family serine protease